ncbi:MAG: hypothetical protein ABI231_12570 [Candidatus Tumulicola sp.]
MDRYSAQISPSARIVENASYDTLLDRICEYMVRAAFARATDRHDWEQDQLRCRGLLAIELFHNGRAVWQDRSDFEGLLSEAADASAAAQFATANELDPGLTERIEWDLRVRWRRAGYMVPELYGNMKKLFEELESYVRDCDRDARDALIAELLSTGPDAARCKGS